jgi:hypothetical protein
MTKKPSGQQNRLRKRAEQEQARKNEEARRTKAGKPSARAMLPPPPVGDPTAAIAYAADCALIALAEVQADEQLTAEQRWGWVDKLTKALGMTYAKASIQHRLKQLVKGDEPEHDEELEPNPFISGASPTG